MGDTQCETNKAGEHDEQLTVEIFLAGSTQDQGYALAKSMLDSIASSLKNEWKEAVSIFGNGNVLPSIVAHSANDSYRQDILTSRIKSSDVVLFFLHSHRKPGPILCHEMEEALGAYLCNGKPYPYFFLEKPDPIFGCGDVEVQKNSTTDILDKIIYKYGFLQDAKYFEYSQHNYGNYILRLTEIVATALVEGSKFKDDYVARAYMHARSHGELRKKDADNPRACYVHVYYNNRILNAGHDVPDTAEYIDKECKGWPPSDKICRGKIPLLILPEKRHQNISLYLKNIDCILSKLIEPTNPILPPLEGGLDARTKKSGNGNRAITVLLVGNTSSAGRSFAKRLIDEISKLLDSKDHGLLPSLRTLDTASDPAEMKNTDVALFFLDDIDDKPEAGVVDHMECATDSFLKNRKPYPYLFVEHSSKGNRMSDNMKDVLNKYGFMQYFVDYSADDLTGFASEIIKTVAASFIDKMCYDNGGADFGSACAHVPSDIRVFTEDGGAVVDGFRTSKLDPKYIRGFMYICNRLRYSSKVQAGFKVIDSNATSKNDRRSIEIFSSDNPETSIALYLVWNCTDRENTDQTGTDFEWRQGLALYVTDSIKSHMEEAIRKTDGAILNGMDKDRNGNTVYKIDGLGYEAQVKLVTECLETKLGETKLGETKPRTEENTNEKVVITITDN